MTGLVAHSDGGGSGRVAVFVGPGQPFELREYRLPTLEPGAVLVRLSLATICGADLRHWLGEANEISAGSGSRVSLGHEMVGLVDRLGDGTCQDAAGNDLVVGDRVVFKFFVPCGACRLCASGRSRACQTAHRFRRRPPEDPPHFHGAFADYIVLAPGTQIVAVPANVPDSSVAGANCAISQVVAGLRLAGLREGDRVVVQGAGAHGLSAVAVARELGAVFVISVDLVADRLRIAPAFGADVCLDLRDFESGAALAAHVRQITSGGADCVVDVAGDVRAVADGLAMLAPGGRYVEIGSVSGGRTIAVDPSVLKLQNQSLFGVSYYEGEDLLWAVAFLARTQQRYPWGLLMGEVFPLDSIDAAFARAAPRDLPRIGLRS